MFIDQSSYVRKPMNIGSFFGVLSAEKMENAAFFHQPLADSWNCCTFAGGFAPIRRRLNITFGRVGQKQYKPGLVHRSKNTPARKIRKSFFAGVFYLLPTRQQPVYFAPIPVLRYNSFVLQR